MESIVEESDVREFEGSDGNEEDREGTTSGEEAITEDTSTRRAGDNVNKPPTRDELRSIKEASDLYKSNTFKLAIDVLLPNVRPKESRIRPLDEFLRLLYAALMCLSPIPPSHPLVASRNLTKRGIAVPYPPPQPSEETAWKVAFEKPSDIVLIGSWATKTGAKSSSSASWTVDIAVEMPASLFQEKDYLDCRFFHKRAYYLASLASAIRSDTRLHVDVFYDSPFDSRLVSLILVPRKDESSTNFSKLNAHVRLLPVLPSPSPVSLHHLSPTHCNLRVKLSEPDASTLSRPTPIYNSDLLMCASARERLLRTHELAQEVSSLRNALALLRVWANQRGYSSGPGNKAVVAGFESRGYFWTTIMHAILSSDETFGQKAVKSSSKRTVGRGLSSYQLFRAALEFIATHDFSSETIFLKGCTRFPPCTYETQTAALVDNCSVNILANIPAASLDLLRRDAKVTLNTLNGSPIGESVGASVDPFDEVFLRDRRQLLTRFDVVLRVDMRKASLRKSNVADMLDYGSPSSLMIHTLSSILRRALGDRVYAIAILVPARDLRSLPQGNTLPALSTVHLGLTLNTENAFRVVDHGPTVTEQDSKEAIEFRDLWGSKAELRRFKDGRIVESVVWEVKSVDARSRIPADIVCHILTRHFRLDPIRDIRTFQKDFDDLLRVPDAFAQQVVLPGVQPGFRSAMMAFDNLVRQLKSLDEEIPLAVLNVSPVSSDLRYTSIFAPIPIPPKSAGSVACTTRYLPSIEIIIQFERSGRWPDELIAVQKMKLAFFEQIANALMTKVSGLRTNIVACTQQTALNNLDTAYLEIVTPEGWAFAAWIWHDREATLLDRINEKRRPAIPNGVSSSSGVKSNEHNDRQLASKAYEMYVRRYLHAPKHHRAVASLCHRFSAFAGTVRLVKRWLSAHWISAEHVTDETIELLCAYVFVGNSVSGSQGDKAHVDVPGSKELGFFRVLTFLKEWAWESGLFVSLYESDENMDNEGGLATMHVKAGSGNGVWTIMTSADRSGRVWTAEGPDAVVARRIKALASASLEYALVHEREGFVPKSLFLHPTSDYDILIRLKSEVLCRAHQSLDPGDVPKRRYANIPVVASEDDELLRVGFDPALMFFNDLNRIYHGTLEFFFDSYGGSAIGAVWDPSLFEERPFRVLADYSTMPSKSDENSKRKSKGTVVMNQTAVLTEIQRLGEGLVKSIEVQRSRP
ncbi:UTP22 [Sanghuangporus vaninii]